jgi:hypothetical protein
MRVMSRFASMFGIAAAALPAGAAAAQSSPTVTAPNAGASKAAAKPTAGSNKAMERRKRADCRAQRPHFAKRRAFLKQCMAESA